MEGKVVNRKHFPFWSLKMGTFSVPSQRGLHLSPLPSLLRSEGENRPTRCSEPLRYKVGGASKPSPWLCGMGPPGDELGLSLDRLAYKDGYSDYMMLVLW